MYRSKCGKFVGNEGNFCKYCGAPVDHDADHVQPPDSDNIQENDREELRQPKTKQGGGWSGKKKWVLSVASIVLVIVAVGIFVMFKGEKEAASFSSLRELPDLLTVQNEDGEFLVSEAGIFNGNEGYGQAAADGTVAIQQTYDGEVQIWGSDKEQKGVIPAPVTYFYLCGSGEKIVYGQEDYTAYLWDVDSGKSKQVAEDKSARGISYSGAAISMRDHYGRYYRSKNGVIHSIGDDDIFAMSPDGKYVYCYRSDDIRESSSENMAELSNFGIRIRNKWHKLLSYSSEDYLYIIAISADYKDVVFGLGSGEVYCFSADQAKEMNYEAQRVSGVNGKLVSLDNVLNRRSLRQSYESDTIYSWLEEGYYDDWYYDQFGQVQPVSSVFGGLYCLLKEQGGMRSVSLVKLVDTQIVELVPYITGSIRLSQDGTKLWCVSDGSLVFCDLSSDDPHVSYCGTSGIKTFDYGYWNGTAFQAPLAMKSDGSEVYFIDVTGTLWMSAPATVQTPIYVEDHVLWVGCSADDEIYYIKGDDADDKYGELYCLASNGQPVYQYDGVADVYMTKSDVYIVAVTSENEYGASQYALYKKDEEDFQLLLDRCYIDRIAGGYWWQTMYH